MNQFHIDKLQRGETTQMRPRGTSMLPHIKSGALVTVEPIKHHTSLRCGDIVFCMVGRHLYVHMIKRIIGQHYEISNAKGKVNGLISSKNIFGKVIRIEP